MNLKNRYLILLLLIILNSCIGTSPKFGSPTNFVAVTFIRGIKITVNEVPRGLGNNITIVECYDSSGTELLVKEQVGWKTTMGIELNNGKYLVKTYSPYLGKNIYQTSNAVIINNDIVSIDIEYPMLISGKAKIEIKN